MPNALECRFAHAQSTVKLDPTNERVIRLDFAFVIGPVGLKGESDDCE